MKTDSSDERIGYFHLVSQRTPTRFWINNPTAAEMEKALSAGALNMTSNPSYASYLIKNEPAYMNGVIRNVIERTGDDDEAADLVQQAIVSRALERFEPLHLQSGAKQGYVTIQGDPRLDDNPDTIIDLARQHRRLGPNCMPKIPATQAGARAMEVLIAESTPLCATEVFAVAQANYVCDLYKRISRESGKRPAFYVTHITGIFDEYLKRVVEREGIEIETGILALAGCTVARKEYRMLRDAGREAILLGGGARELKHFTEFVGGDMHVTLNWRTAKALIELNPPPVVRIDAPVPAQALAELCGKLPDFRRAFQLDGLAPEDFAKFGPVVFFRNLFLAGYGHLLAEIAAHRRAGISIATTGRKEIAEH
jgi:transaldolase